jgi:hypothetical protein
MGSRDVQVIHHFDRNPYVTQYETQMGGYNKKSNMAAFHLLPASSSLISVGL